MTKSEAIGFLRSHQPMPPDSEVTEALAARYDEVRRHFADHPDPECIPLFLNSFGDGDCFGVYQLVDDVLYKFSSEQVVPHLVNALGSPLASVRSWASEFSAYFSEGALVPPLTLLLHDSDPDTRGAAAIALGFSRDSRAVSSLQKAIQRETDPSVVELMQDALTDLRSAGVAP